MGKKSTEPLKNHFSVEQLCILDMYEMINKRFIQKNYKIEVEVLEVLIKFFKSNKEKELSIIWDESSLQKTIFLFCVEVWKHYEIKKEITKEDFEDILVENMKNPFVKKDLLNMYPEISKFCKYTERDSLINIFFFEDDIFKITNINNETFFKTKKYFSTEEVFFYIVTSGIVAVNKTLIFKGEAYCSNKEPILEEINGVTDNYSLIMFGVKKEFIKKLNLDFLEEYGKKFPIYSLEVFSLIIKNKKINKENYFQLYQIVTYLSHCAKGHKIKLFKIPYLEYKGELIKIIEENIVEEEREIIEKICQNIGVSIPTLYKIFNSLFRESPTKYIERRKMNHTCFYLCNTDESIEKIGEKVGYSRRLYCKKFLEFSGYMPTEFRRMMVE